MKYALLCLLIAGCSGGGGVAPVVAATTAPILVAIGDSITADNIGMTTTNYPTIVARDLGLTEVNLAVSGYMTTDWLTNKSALLPKNAAVVLINLGTNDAYFGTFAAFAPAYETVLADVRATSPNARVVLLNVRDSDPTKTAAIAAVNAYINAEPLLIVDLDHAAALYDPANLHDPVHPNTAGAAIIATMVEAALH